MANKQMNGLVPRLRFPEFQEAGEWKIKKLIDTADKTVKWCFIGGPFGSNLKSSDYVAEGIRVIQLQNIGDGEFLDDYKIFTSKEKADELLSNNIYPGDIILSKMGDPVGRACLIPDTSKRYVMCSDGIRLVVDQDLNDKYFIYLLINGIQFRSLVEKTATGSTRKRIGLDDLKNLPMLLPKKREQQKIADCLSSLDALISAQADKLDALKTHKKGLMQQLFPREGETVPRLRFPEFQEAGEWEEKLLEDVAPLQRGFDLPTQKLEPGKVPVVYSNGIQNFHSIGMAKGPGLITGRSGTIGKLHFIEEGDYWPHNTTLWVTSFRNNVPKFIYYFYAAIGLERFVSGSGVPTLNRNYVHAFTAHMPQLKEEQQKIADCLFSLDALISAQADKLDALKTHKKGLMQQLFPVASAPAEEPTP